LALVFAFTFLGLVWLARDVDRGISNRTAAQSIAFQAARSGAQELSIDSLRAGEGVAIDEPAARSAAQRTATTLFASYRIQGAVEQIVVEGDRISVRVSITDSGRTVTGIGAVRAERAP
jgi:hypothetical protein